jgi:uncharacterized repeat protein (TIGR01451 family)
MARRGWFVVLALVGLCISTQTADGQPNESAPNLVDRFNTLRKGWSWRYGAGNPISGENSASMETWSQSPEARRENRTRPGFSSLPQVDAERLLPRHWQATEVRQASVPSIAQRKKSNARNHEVSNRPSKSRRAPSSAQRSLPPSASGLTALPRSRVGATRLSGAGNAGVSQERPSSKVRRSPPTGRRNDFDPETLRRELVDATGRSFPRSIKKSGSQKQGRNPIASKPVVSSAPVNGRKDEIGDLPSHSPVVAVKRSPIAYDETSDQKRVTSAGEKAFAPEKKPAKNLTQQEGSFRLVDSAVTKSDAIVNNQSAENGFTAAATGPGGKGDLLATGDLPAVRSRVSGPRQILIGREATFEVHFGNQGTIRAREVIAQIEVPSWVDVVDTMASNGVIQQTEVTDEFTTYRWQLQELAGQGNETLKLKVIPQASKPLKLGVHWRHAAVDSEVLVEVQEPKLRLQVSGPDEVFFNSPQIYRLTLSNSGTGVAEEVSVDLFPPAGNEKTVSTHQVGNLHPGASKTVEVELMPREAGKLSVKATASALGGITAESEKDIFCRKPELEVDWRGPTKKYAGTVATYYFRVRNPGTASADNVDVGVRLPRGAEFVSGSEGHLVDPTKQTLTWKVGSLLPGDDRYMELKCILTDSGTNHFSVTAATAKGDLTDTKSAEVNVTALADLKLDVIDPKGPIAVGEEAIYEIHVKNRGQNTAEEVDVVALFSAGVDAQTVEGAEYSVADGRVTFATIKKLEAGQEIVLKIHSRASEPGVHLFRAEVVCRDLEIKLAVEETTRFFADELPGNSTDPKSAGAFGPYEDARY